MPRHGKTSRVRHHNHPLFQGLENPFEAARYHSLMVNVLSDELQVTAWSDDDVVMGLSHPEYPLHGVQFHPESFLTPGGAAIIANFLNLGPLGDPARRPVIEARPAAARLTIHAAAQAFGP